MVSKLTVNGFLSNLKSTEKHGDVLKITEINLFEPTKSWEKCIAFEAYVVINNEFVIEVYFSPIKISYNFPGSDKNYFVGDDQDFIEGKKRQDMARRLYSDVFHEIVFDLHLCETVRQANETGLFYMNGKIGG